MQDTPNEAWDKQAHNALVSQGLSWEHARIAVGIMAEQRQLADREGYDRGFNDGHKSGQRDPDPETYDRIWSKGSEHGYKLARIIIRQKNYPFL